MSYVLILKIVEIGITWGINYLLNHKEIGIGNKLAQTVVSAVAKSKANDTNEDMFKDALEVLEAS